MKMKNIAAKLLSRKLWMAVAGLAAGVYLALGGEADEVQTIAGAVTSLASLVTYIVTEGRIDAAAAGAAAGAVQSAVDAFMEAEDGA